MKEAIIRGDDVIISPFCMKVAEPADFQGFSCILKLVFE